MAYRRQRRLRPSIARPRPIPPSIISFRFLSLERSLMFFSLRHAALSTPGACYLTTRRPFHTGGGYSHVILRESCESPVNLRQTAVAERPHTATTRLEPAAVGPGDHLAAGTGAASDGSGKAGGDLDRVGLRKAGFDPVRDAAMLPDQGVGGHAQRHRIVHVANSSDEHMRRARNPPGRRTGPGRLLQW